MFETSGADPVMVEEFVNMEIWFALGVPLIAAPVRLAAQFPASENPDGHEALAMTEQGWAAEAALRAAVRLCVDPVMVWVEENAVTPSWAVILKIQCVAAGRMEELAGRLTVNAPLALQLPFCAARYAGLIGDPLNW